MAAPGDVVVDIHAAGQTMQVWEEHEEPTTPRTPRSALAELLHSPSFSATGRCGQQGVRTD